MRVAPGEVEFSRSFLGQLPSSSDMSLEVFPVLHNANSPQRVVEIARAAYGLGYPLFVITKPTGAAAQVGVPEAHKVALKEGKPLVVLPDLAEAIELLKADAVILVTARKLASKPLTRALGEAISRGAKRVLLVFGGAEPGLSARELSLGEQAYIDDVEQEVGPVALAVISLYVVRRLLAGQT